MSPRPVAALALCLAAFPALLAAPAHAEAPPVVGTLVIAETPVHAQASYVGRVRAEHIVSLQARVTGYLEQRDFKEGEAVSAGQVLYVIEQPPYQAAVAQAEAAVAQAKAQAVNAAITLKRNQRLLSTPAGQQSLVDDAKAAADADAAAVQATEAQLQTAQINLGYTEIKAPIAGRIGATAVDTGNVVGPNSGVLATIVSEDPMYVVFSVPVRDALRLRAQLAGQGGFAALDVSLTLPDGRTYAHTGRIEFLNNRVTQDTDSWTLRATLPNPALAGLAGDGASARELQDGEFVNVTLRDSKPENRIVIPRDAVLTDQFGDFVLAVDAADKVRRRDVTLGQTTDTTAVVEKGLAPGDRIVIDGLQKIRPGIAVSPKAETADLSGAGAGGDAGAGAGVGAAPAPQG